MISRGEEISLAWPPEDFRHLSDSLRYVVLHDPGCKRGFVLFDLQGERTWPHPPGEPMDEELIETLRAQCGIEVLEVPRLNQLRLEEP